MKRGEIYFMQLDPTLGSETQKKRPVVIVSNNSANKGQAKLVTIVPLTSNISKVYPFEVYLDASTTGLKKHSKAMCNQVRTVSQKRVCSKRLGSVQTMEAIDHALKLHLNLF